MSRDISATNLAEINAAHLHEVLLVKLEFDTPVYCHSGVGTISYGGNSYLGVGQFGAVTGAGESEDLRPSPLTLTLSGVDSTLIAEALEAGEYGDPVTIYSGYRQDDGTLVDDPVIMWSGTLENASIVQGKTSAISITVQHDLAVLDEADGGRFTDEDQQVNFSGDVGFEFVADMVGLRLIWGGGRVNNGTNGGGTSSDVVQEK